MISLDWASVTVYSLQHDSAHVHVFLVSKKWARLVDLTEGLVVINKGIRISMNLFVYYRVITVN